jgi:hypothetical protein
VEYVELMLTFIFPQWLMLLSIIYSLQLMCRERGERALEQRLAGENAATAGGGIEVTSHGESDDTHA